MSKQTRNKKERKSWRTKRTAKLKEHEKKKKSAQDF
jgi:hypothetical protein